MRGINMYDLILHNGVPVVSSRDIAKKLEKQHKNVLRDIQKMIKNSMVQIGAVLFESDYLATNGKTNKQYLLTKDGFMLYMFNIQGYNDFKLEYINKFNEMENIIKNSSNNTLHKEVETLRQQVHLLVDNMNKIMNVMLPVLENKPTTPQIQETIKHKQPKKRLYTTKEISEKYGYNAHQTIRALIRRNIIIKTPKGYGKVPK